MFRAILPAAAAVAAVLPFMASAAALPGAAEGARFAPVIEALERRDFGAAAAIAAGVGDPAAETLVLWRQLGREEGGWRTYQRFLARHPDWPGRRGMRAEAERLMPAGLPPAEVRAFFADDAPRTGAGALRLIDAHRAEGRSAEAEAVAARAWTTLSLNAGEETALLAVAAALGAHHAERLEMLLWRGLTGEAERMLPRVDAGLAALGRARIALRRGEGGVNALIDRVPPALAGDGGLAYERFRWRDAKGLDPSAIELMLERSTSVESLGRPKAWADRRRRFARSLARNGDARTAYRLASAHFTTPEIGYGYADLEWLSGWLALRRLNDPGAAEAHFERFIAAVGTPISNGRGWYWLGRARAARGDRAGAEAAFREGARWQTSFYGQLAAEAAGVAPDPSLAGSPAPTDWRSAQILAREPVRAAVLAHWAGDRRLSWRLMVHAATALAETPRDFAALGALALELDRPEIAVRVGKAAARKGLVMATPYYPVTGLARASGPVHPALALAIARTESELNPDAISPAGARGLMQVMPATARQVSRRLGLAYSRAALTEDWRFNARLGTDYLRGLWDEFGSIPLVAVGYNAGPGRARDWVGRYGDPRGRDVEWVVDWIENIPFDETRNYVQRVIEARQVYAARIEGAAAPLQTGARLR